MNWLQKTVLSQQSQTLEGIILSVATGNVDSNSALQQLQQLNAPTPECCSVIMSMYQLYPGGQVTLDAMARQLRCSEIAPEPQQNLPPEVEQPMQMPSGKHE